MCAFCVCPATRTVCVGQLLLARERDFLSVKSHHHFLLCPDSKFLAILVFLTYFDFVIFAVSYWWPTGLALQFLLQVLKWEAWTSEILLVQRQELEETYAVQHKNLAKIGNSFKISFIYCRYTVQFALTSQIQQKTPETTMIARSVSL